MFGGSWVIRRMYKEKFFPCSTEDRHVWVHCPKVVISREGKDLKGGRMGLRKNLKSFLGGCQGVKPPRGLAGSPRGLAGPPMGVEGGGGAARYA